MALRVMLLYADTSILRKYWHTVCFGLYHDTQTGRLIFITAFIAIEPGQL